MYKPLLCLLAVSSFPVAAGTFSHTSNCASARNAQYTSTYSCVGGNGVAFGDNFTNVSSGFHLNLGTTNTLAIDQSAHAYLDFQDLPRGSQTGIPTSARGTINYSESLITSGPVRGGFLHIIGSPFQGSASDGSDGQVTFNISNTSPEYASPSETCFAGFFNSNCQPGYVFFSDRSPYIPITLGTPFTLTGFGSMNAFADTQEKQCRLGKL